MKLNELLTYCEDLQDVEVVIHDEIICGKANMLNGYLCKDALYMNVQSIIADDGAVKVWVGCNE